MHAVDHTHSRECGESKHTRLGRHPLKASGALLLPPSQRSCPRADRVLSTCCPRADRNLFASLPEELLHNMTSLVTFKGSFLAKLKTLPERFFARQGT